MKDKSIFFHCGLPKTGSTFLQEQVFPLMHTGTYINKPRGSIDKIIYQLANSKSPILISEENLLGRESLLAINNINILERHKLILKSIKTTFPYSKIILFLRAPEESIISNYKQYIYGGGILKFEDWVELDGIREQFDYPKLISIIESFFNKKDFLLINYNQLLSEPNKVINIMEKYIGCKFLYDINSNKKSNVSISNMGLILLRRLNKLKRSKLNPTGSKIWKKIMYFIKPQDLFKLWPLNILNKIGYPIISHNKYFWIKEEFSSSWNKTLSYIEQNQNLNG